MGLKMAQHRAPSHFKEEPGHDSVSATFCVFFSLINPPIVRPSRFPQHIQNFTLRVLLGNVKRLFPHAIVDIGPAVR